jgi:CRISPR system Cascade subunit CasB
LTQQQTSREAAFVKHLVSLHENENRAALAVLRRGLGKPLGSSAEVWRYVATWTRNLPNWRADCYYLVASLFALHPDSVWPESELHRRRRPPNLGDSFKRLEDQQHRGQPATADKGQDHASPMERRFVALLNCHWDDLDKHLRQAVSLLKSKEVPVNWAQLLRDIQGWDHDDHPVQRRWARAFWGSSTQDTGQGIPLTGQAPEDPQDNSESNDYTDQ